MASPVTARSIAFVAVLIAPALAACGGSSSGPTSTAAWTSTVQGGVTVPNVVGENMDAAATAIVCAGLKAYPDRVVAGVPPSSIAHVVHTVPLVVSMRPPANSSVPRGTTVHLRYLSPPNTFIAVSVSCPK